MPPATRMARYDIRNDGAGPYGVFYCDKCGREYRSQPDVAGTIAADVGRQAMGGILRGVPLFGRAVADSVAGQDQRDSMTLTPQQLDGAWKQVQQYFRECATCHQIVCLSDFDEQTGMCKEDSPRRAEIAQAEAEQVAGAMKGIANVLGLSGAFVAAGQAAQAASTMTARCPKDGTVAPPGTKFCPQCGGPMIQPAADPCPNCGSETRGAKFCPECGTKIERAAAGTCPSCGAETKGAKFCPECGTKL